MNFTDPEVPELVKYRNDTGPEFLRVLAACHNVTLFRNTYNANSRDELALVMFVKFMRVEFLGRDSTGFVRVKEFGIERKYELLHSFEFTSSRKRMSVVGRDETSRVWIFSKGANSVILQISIEKFQSGTKASFQGHLDGLSNIGLRTLVLARREILADEPSRFNVGYQVAQTNMGD